MEVIFTLGVFVFLLGTTYTVGSSIERSHFRSLENRERASRAFPVLTLKNYPESWEVSESTLVSGNVVISIDYFKRFVANLRNFVGGNLTTYEPLLDRARREAVLRLKQEAHAQGFDAVVNLKLVSANIASSVGNNEGTTGVEVLAYGTAIKHRK